MTINQNTLLLDQSAWDLVLDSNGNIALAGAHYSIAQDVASAIRTFLGECWYNTSLGIPYYQDILGQQVSLPFLKQKISKAALSIPNVVQVEVIFNSFQGRQLSGQVQILDTDGQAANIPFG